MSSNNTHKDNNTHIIPWKPNQTESHSHCGHRTSEHTHHHQSRQSNSREQGRSTPDASNRRHGGFWKPHLCERGTAHNTAQLHRLTPKPPTMTRTRGSGCPSQAMIPRDTTYPLHAPQQYPVRCNMANNARAIVHIRACTHSSYVRMCARNTRVRE
jgi:hypothetical protein